MCRRAFARSSLFALHGGVGGLRQFDVVRPFQIEVTEVGGHLILHIDPTSGIDDVVKARHLLGGSHVMPKDVATDLGCGVVIHQQDRKVWQRAD